MLQSQYFLVCDRRECEHGIGPAAHTPSDAVAKAVLKGFIARAVNDDGRWREVHLCEACAQLERLDGIAAKLREAEAVVYEKRAKAWHSKPMVRAGRNAELGTRSAEPVVTRSEAAA